MQAGCVKLRTAEEFLNMGQLCLHRCSSDTAGGQWLDKQDMHSSAESVGSGLVTSSAPTGLQTVFVLEQPFVTQAWCTFYQVWTLPWHT